MIKAVQDFLNDGSMSSQNSVAGEEKGEGKDDLDDGELHGQKKFMISSRSWSLGGQRCAKSGLDMGVCIRGMCLSRSACLPLCFVRADDLEEGERKEKEGKEGHEKKDKEASDLLPHLVAPLMNHSALSVGSHGTYR